MAAGDSTAMNERLTERLRRSGRPFSEAREQALIWVKPPQLNPKVRQYFEDAKTKAADGGPWLDRREFPSSGEVLDTDTNGSSSSGVVGLQCNQLEGAWLSKEAYLGAVYELYREDAIRPLREAVQLVKFTPTANEEAFNGAVGIYDKVHICGVTPSTRGIAVKVAFSLIRTGKKILWEQSKRLISGGLVVLTPKNDMFQTTAIVATVAARPLAALEQNPPEIDLFIDRAEELEIDPNAEFVMVEDRGGQYEANRHTLLALQKMMREPFPLSEHLVSVNPSVDPPKYLLKDPVLDMTSVLNNNKHEMYDKVDILNSWPTQPSSDLDASQLAALQRILTKRLAIVQGPPGTGKTFVTVQAIKIMLANRRPEDPPIIIACQTNHAVDQLLLHVAEFEPQFVRLGGRSKDQGVVKARTLYNLKEQTSRNIPRGSIKQQAKHRMKNIETDLKLLLLPLTCTLEKSPLKLDTLTKLGLLTEAQAASLDSGASQWVQGNLTNPNEARSPFNIWLGKSLISVPPKQQPEDFGFDYEEADLEFEQLRELEAENAAKDDDDFETLSGVPIPLADNFTAKKDNKKANISEAKIQEMLKQQDMWKISEGNRPAIYRYLQSEMKKIILASFRIKAKEFNEQAALRRIGNFELDELVLKEQKIIAMTTTGLSKYRALIAALEPKIVFIEEAAEILEAPVTAACLPSVEHLILVGDHQQLRPHCHVKAYENKPYYLNVSLFERLVMNNVEFSMLRKQRRMIPEIRRLLHPIYRNKIEDHQSVLNPAKRPNVPGMGGVNSFFFTHQWWEQRDEQMSSYNPEEAEMIVDFVEYLFYNGMPTEQITILTFYNGQRKRILRLLRQRPSLAGQTFIIVTVDSYQGEENSVVLLSLVRSNDMGKIGFLDNINRVCVALSRAQRGFYIFGNGSQLYRHKIWQKVIDIIANNGKKEDRLATEPRQRLGDSLPVRCSNHNNLTEIKSADDFKKINGGCTELCGGHLPCGHPCGLTCHPFSHDGIMCQQPCVKMLSCGHQCSSLCGEACVCNLCVVKKKSPKKIKAAGEEDVRAFDGKETLEDALSTDSCVAFSEDEPGHYVAGLKPKAAALFRSTHSACSSTSKADGKKKMYPKRLKVREEGEWLAIEGSETVNEDSSTDSWKSFAETEPRRYANAVKAANATVGSSHSSHSSSSSAEQITRTLVDVQAASMQQLSLTSDSLRSPPTSGSTITGISPKSAVTVIEEKVISNGQRTKRRELFATGPGQLNGSASKEVAKEDWSREPSLLD